MNDETQCATRYPALVERAFTRGLSARQYRRLRVHLRDCKCCRSDYDRLTVAHQALEGDAAFLPGVLEHMSAQVGASASSKAKGRAFSWGVAASLAAATAVIAIALWPKSGGEPSMTARGGSTDQFFDGDRKPGVRLFCIRTIAGQQTVVAQRHTVEPTFPEEPLECTINDELQLAYSTPSLGTLTMVAFAENEKGELFWYAPMSEGDTSLRLEPDAIDMPLDWSTRMSAQHSAGRYNLTVRFFQQPVLARDAADGVVAPIVELHSVLDLREAP